MKRVHALRLFAAAGAALLLGGCLPTTLYHKAGTPVHDARADEIACKRIALAQAPVEREHEIIPGPLLRGPLVCDDQNNCYREPPWRAPPEIIVRDVNEDLRNLIARQCMADRGYDRITLPACSQEVAQRSP